MPVRDPVRSNKHLRYHFSKNFLVSLVLLGLFALSAGPAMAQEYSLFDRFSLQLGGGFLGLSTEMRLDANELDLGTVINFEDDLDLDSSKIVPSLGFRARLGKRHLIDTFWTKADRGSTSQALTDIEFGDISIPLDAEVSLSFEQEELLVGYSYYFMLRDRWALGVRGGFRWLKLQAFLTIIDTDISDEGDTSAPLPFVGLSFRFGITPKLRLISDFGWLSLEVGDVDGSQFVGDASLEYLAWKNVSFGAALGLSSIDVEVTDSDLTGSIDMGGTALHFFVKGRW